jgi:hypothetical protein
MIKRHQLFLHEPHNEIWGDCHRTAIACLLDKEPWEVPHFGQLHATTPNYDWRAAEREYLATLGLAMFDVVFGDLESAFRFMDGWNYDIYYLMGGMSPRGTNHTVVCRGGEFYWDPHPAGGFLVGPMDCDFYQITVLIPLSMTTAG